MWQLVHTAPMVRHQAYPRMSCLTYRMMMPISVNDTYFMSSSLIDAA